MEVEIPYELLKDDQQKQLGKNDEAKMTLFNALPHKEYERFFMCKTAKEKITWLHFLFNELIGNLNVYEMILENDVVASKTTKEKVKSLALKAKVTREQTSDDSDSQRGSDEVIDKDEVEAFNLIARNFCKFFHKNNQFRRNNRFGNRANRFEKGRRNGLGTKATKAQNKSKVVIIAGKKVTSLVNV
nr:zf-CCHC domain-containing protein/DUF4219 domain-containing protein/UBN2 domain-containing protein [Tanacetum cinerariifolium]